MRDISCVFSFSEEAEDWILNTAACDRMTDEQKRAFLTNNIMTDKNFNYPFGSKTNQKVFLSKVHNTGVTQTFKYSLDISGALCVPCVLFGVTEVENDRGKVTVLKSFVTQPFCKYEKVSERLKQHIGNDYHSWAQEKADISLNVIQKADATVIDQLD